MTGVHAEGSARARDRRDVRRRQGIEVESADEAPEVLPEAPSDFGPGVAPLALPSNGREIEQRILHALDELRQHDSNRYVRLRSAAALRQIALQEVQ